MHTHAPQIEAEREKERGAERSDRERQLAEREKQLADLSAQLEAERLAERAEKEKQIGAWGSRQHGWGRAGQGEWSTRCALMLHKTPPPLNLTPLILMPATHCRPA